MNPDNLTLFDGLTNNTTYNVKVDSVVFNNLNYANVYTMSTSDITLKSKPTPGEISVKVSDDGKDYLYHKYFLINNEELKQEDKDLPDHIFNSSVYLEFK